MLDRADAIVIERDAHLPGLRTLLDTEAFCATLQRLCPDRDIRAATARYVRYKPQTSCLVAYEVAVGRESIGVYARCHAEDQLVKVTNARLRMEVRSTLGPGLLTDPHAGIAVFAYPNDYEIKSLRKLFEGDRTPPRLRRMLPAHPHLHATTPTPLRYKPERRFVGKFASEEGPAAVLRLYPEPMFAGVREKAWAFKDSGQLQVPRVIGDSARYSALAHEWIEGQPLVEILTAPANAAPVLGRVASALTELHRQRPRLSSMYSASDYCRSLESACAAVGVLDDTLGQRARELLEAVQPLVLERPWRSQAVHGDFTADQVLVQNDRVAVLDYDRAAYGDPVMDVGAFAAGLISLSLHGQLPMSRAVAMAGEFAAAYWQAAGFEDVAGARTLTAGSLLMMAPEPFRHRHPEWPRAIAALLESADRVLVQEAIDA
ncbi:hypothetical protein MNBD_PLANCTO03-2303 [hydrothermal vent metagenome]|uniref:Aminoglycoside phosphotransferase domain-containing protein n=1 Tax=hydrothermal vent metagenome TaxID=652676 RepID=A0A3B1DYS5_9ZZZZ